MGSGNSKTDLNAAATGNAGARGGSAQTGSSRRTFSAEDDDTSFMALGDLHSAAPLAPSEDVRLKYLKDTAVLDSAPEERFDDITQLLHELYQVPIALVSIVDAERQWFKSVVGLPVKETGRDVSFCAWTLVNHVAQVLVVPDAKKDARFVNNALVTNDPLIRFYMGSPIISMSGHRLGSLCLIDRTPRSMTPESCVFLSNMADIVAREIEDPRGKICNKTAVMLLSTASNQFPVMYINSVWQAECGISKAEAVHKSLFSQFSFIGKDLTGAIYEAVSSGKDGFFVELKCNNNNRNFKLHFRSAFTEILFDDSSIIGAPLGILDGSSQDPSAGIENTMIFVILEAMDTEEAGSVATEVLPMDELIPEERVPKDHVPQDIIIGMPVGKGAYATVYRGKWTGIEVAVKVFRSQGDIAEEGYTPTEEAQMMRNLSHPHVVSAYHHISQVTQAGDNEVWLCLELCTMGTLASNYMNGFFRKPNQQWSLDMGKITRVAYQVASAMAYVHSKGIIHSDLTTNNILLQEDQDQGFKCKLSDFGIARELENGEDSITTECHGTVTYMAPELLMDCKLSKAADVYSFGVLMWEIYHNKRPFEGMIHAQIIAQVALKDMRPEISSDCPDVIRDIIEECWTSEDEERPTFEELRDRLSTLMAKHW